MQLSLTFCQLVESSLCSTTRGPLSALPRWTKIQQTPILTTNDQKKVKKRGKDHAEGLEGDEVGTLLLLMLATSIQINPIASSMKDRRATTGTMLVTARTDDLNLQTLEEAAEEGVEGETDALAVRSRGR